MAEVEVWEAILLGVVQGVTEWLPISSDGHLVIVQQVLGIDAPVAYDLLLHVGTLGALTVVYRRRLASMAKGLWQAAWLRAAASPDDRAEARLVGLLAIGTVPGALAGLLFKDRIEALFSSLLAAGVGLLVTGILLASTRLARPGARTRVTALDAALVGLLQAASPLPGVSRSGTTITMGLHRGLAPAAAADFSFLLAFPLLLGATVLQAPHLAELDALGWAPLAAGLVTSALVGYMAIRAMLAFVRRRPVALFAPYCLAVGAAIVAAAA